MLPTTKKALLIGLEYQFPSQDELQPLGGIHHALHTFERHLRENYLPTNITIMEDIPSALHTPLFPTKDNILREIRTLVHNVRDGDHRLFFFAGHGSQSKPKGPTMVHIARQNVEDSQKADENEGVLTAEDIRSNLIAAMPKGSRLIIIADACYSGGLCDVPYWLDAAGSGIRHSLPSLSPSSQFSSPSPQVEILFLEDSCKLRVLESAAAIAQVVKESSEPEQCQSKKPKRINLNDAATKDSENHWHKNSAVPEREVGPIPNPGDRVPARCASQHTCSPGAIAGTGGENVQIGLDGSHGSQSGSCMGVSLNIDTTLSSALSPPPTCSPGPCKSCALCTTSEASPDVIFLASCGRKERTWSSPDEDLGSFTTHLISLLEKDRLPWDTTLHRLSNKLRDVRIHVLENYWIGQGQKVKHAQRRARSEKVKLLQTPVLGCSNKDIMSRQCVL